MTRLSMTLMIVCAAAAMAGCANAPYTLGQNVDTEKVAAVDKAAARTGVRVIWVNPPEKQSR